MDKYGVQIEAWAPFGEGRGGLFQNEALAAIGAKYGKSTAQVMLRWHIQRGVVVIPKSTHYERMVENFNVFDFTLTDEDMSAIAALDKKQSSFFSHYKTVFHEPRNACIHVPHGHCHALRYGYPRGHVPCMLFSRQNNPGRDQPAREEKSEFTVWRLCVILDPE